jgi:putative membrane protein
MKFLKLDYILGLLLLGGTNAFAPVSKTVMTPTTSTSLNLESLEQKTPDYEETERLLQTYSEKSRVYRRNVYTSADWVKSRRSNRFVRNILTTFDSGLLRQLQPELTFIMAVSAFIVVYNDLFIEGYVDLSGVKHEALLDFLPALQLPITPFSLSSGALGLLLTFRTNVSYSRWNEARTAWGKVINDSRSIARMGCIWSKSYKGIDDAAVQRLGDAICSFSRALMNRTLPPQEDEENFKKYTYEKITDQSYGEVLRNAKHRPTAALAELTSTLVDFKLNPLHQVEVEKVVTGLCDALGASERIFTSPVPTFYTRHTSRFLAFWLLALPLGLYGPLGNTWNHWVVIPVVVFIGIFLLGIEELATQLEEPFSILPMEKMCEGSIRVSVMEQVERSQMGIQAPYYGEGSAVNVANPYAGEAFAAPPAVAAPVMEAVATNGESMTNGANGASTLGAGGMSDTRDPEAYSDNDPRKSISSAPTFEEYMMYRQGQ